MRNRCHHRWRINGHARIRQHAGLSVTAVSGGAADPRALCGFNADLRRGNRKEGRRQTRCSGVGTAFVCSFGRSAAPTEE